MSFLKVFKTKTALTGLAMIVTGIANQVNGDDGVTLILEGAALIFLRRGIQKGG